MAPVHLLLGLVCVVGCAGAEAMTATPAPAPAAATEPAPTIGLVAGETMAFEVRLAGVLAGEAHLAVGQPGEVGGVAALVVRSRAATAGAAALLKNISDEATTVVDLASGRPLTLDAIVTNGAKRMTANAVFAGSTATVTYQRDQDPHPRTTRLQFGTTTVYDAHTAMAQLRGWRATRGDVRTVYVIGGRRLWRVDVTHLGEDTIGSALGNLHTQVFEGKSYRARPDLTLESDRPTRTFKVWLSDDADRVPLKVIAATELGDITLELTEYNR